MTDDHLTILTTTPEESATVADIGKTTFYETWRAVNTEEDMLQYMKASFDVNIIRGEISDSKNNLFLLARFEDKVVGYVKLRRDRTYEEFKGDSTIEIERIYVKKEFQGWKIGKRLMDRCIEIAKKEQHLWLWLGVNMDNKNAIDFYKLFHFEVFGTKSFQLGSAVDQDFLMKLRID